MLNLDNWEWSSPRDGIPVNQRRGLNGRYRFFHDEHLHDAIMLRYIGVKWSVRFQKAMTKFRATPGVWKSPASPIPEEDRQRREYFLGYPFAKATDTFNSAHSQYSAEADSPAKPESVEAYRLKYFKEILLEQLTKQHNKVRGSYDSDPKDGDTRKSSIQISQTLLHTLATEILLKTHLGEDQVVVKNDFKWFGPTLPHSTIFAVLKFLNVSDKWITFFRKVLEALVRFAEDRPDAAVRISKRGTPPSSPSAMS
jgi:hypothetical protein